MANSNDSSQLSKGPAVKDTPVKQHHRMACGEKISGTDNPNGGEADTTHKIANSKVNY